MANSDKTMEYIKLIKGYMEHTRDSLQKIADLMLELELIETERLAKHEESKRTISKINSDRSPEVQNFMDYIDRLFGIEEKED